MESLQKEDGNSSTAPTITLPISEFLEILWGYKDKSVIGHESSIAQCLSANSNEAIFHLQIQEKVIIVWRARDWLLDAQRIEQQRKDSDTRVATWNLRQKIKEELKELICAKMGRLGVEDSFAETILVTKNVGLASAMGGSEDLCKKIQTLK